MKPIAGTSASIGTCLALGLTLAATASAQAQTTVTRQITREPVETIVTQSPNGAAVTRRILTPEPGVTTLPPPSPYAAPPLGADALAPDYVEPVETVTTRRVVTSAPAPAPARSTVGIARSRTRVTHNRAVKTETRVVTRTVLATPPLPPPYQPLLLNPAERDFIYRGITRQALYYPAPPYPPVLAQTEAYDYPLRGTYPVDYGYADYDYAYREPRYPFHWDGVPLVVGARMPPSVALYAVPDWMALRIPSTRGYVYARFDERLYLIDPTTSIIVAEIAP
jgi:Protein of unknown function (DUF1236)